MDRDDKRHSKRAHAAGGDARARASGYAPVSRARAALRAGNDQAMRIGRMAWESPTGMVWRQRIQRWQAQPEAGVVVLLGGTALLTLLVALLDKIVMPLPNPGVVYLPLIGMLAYYWGWRYGVAAGILQLACVALFFIRPTATGTSYVTRALAQLVVLAAVTGFILALVQLAANRRALAEREAGRFAALASVGRALASELDETKLLHLIAETARDLTGAGFAAFTLRPVDALGQPLVPAEGALFHLAAVVGVTKEQEALFRRVPLGGEGLLAPIFRHGMPVRVADALAAAPQAHSAPMDTNQRVSPGASTITNAREQALAYVHGHVAADALPGVGIPRGHPIVRSFLGAPLFDRSGHVRGGLLLGHTAPNRFTREHEALLAGLAAQAAVALENVRLFHAAQTQAQELDAIFESITDGVTVLDEHGRVLRENDAARQLRGALTESDDADGVSRRMLMTPAAHALEGKPERNVPMTVADELGEDREFLVSASPVRLVADAAEVAPNLTGSDISQRRDHDPMAAVVVWHDVTEARKLLSEQRARADAEARWALLQLVVDELPSGVYLVRGTDARLMLANRAAMAVWGATWPVGQSMSDFLASSGTRILAPDGQPLVGDHLATLRAVRTGLAVRHHQEIIRHSDGTTLPILLNAVTLDPSLAADSTTGASPASVASEPVALVVLQDVTALKEAERLKDEFIAIAAHELRNPMTAIKGYADLLHKQAARGSGTPLEEWQVEALETIDTSTSRLVELTEDLLDVTRLQAGRLELRLEAHDLVALARRVATRLQVTTQRHTLRVDAHPEHIVVEVDVKRLEQVLNNLLNNAIKYSPDGGTITVTIDENAASGMAHLRVRDQGIGIPADQQALIFGRFARADNAKEQGISGTGLGLYLSRELVERHAGRIWFESVEGTGTTFHITLPLITDDTELGA